jgi:hypothetical protein
MPIYQHQDKVTGKTLEILRNFDEYLDSPTEEEAKAGGLTEEEAKNAEWVKLIGKNIRVTRGESWSGSKGNWLILLGIGEVLWRLLYQGLNL